MSRLFKWLAASLMILSFVCCAWADTTQPPAPKEETFKIEVINESTSIAIFLLCVLPAESNKCVVGNLAVYPKVVLEKYDPTLPSSVSLNLPAGKYAFVFFMFNVLTNDEERVCHFFEVFGDGELTFGDKTIDANNS